MITKEQALNAHYFHEDGCKLIVGPRGGMRTHVAGWRRNGRTKTWKTRPDEFRIPVKYGLRHYGYITHWEADHVHEAGDCPIGRWVAMVDTNVAARRRMRHG